MKQYGVLASLTISQAILESAWGCSKLTMEANNLFGVKADSSWIGEKYLANTAEYNKDRTKYYIDDYFRKYPSWSDSIADHTKFLTTIRLDDGSLRYGNLLYKTDYKEVCSLIAEDGYATDPEYPVLLIKIIEKYKLYQYDT